MSRIALLGATGSLGSHVARLAVETDHELSVFVRTPSKLAPKVASASNVGTGDLLQAPKAQLAQFIAGHDALISCAGLVTEGALFVDLFDRVVSAVEALPTHRQPKVCWFLAGAGLLDLDASGRCGIDLPKVGTTYWPHKANFVRLQRSVINWRLLCPGPMVPGEPVRLERLRVSTDRLPTSVPSWTVHLPGAFVLPLFAARIPEMIIPYADAAAFMLSNLAQEGPLTRKRIGLALPAGMKGTKKHWVAQSSARS